MKFLPSLIPLILMFSVLGIVMLAKLGVNLYQKHKKRRSPFTQNFLRSPGESLNEKLIDISEEMLINAMSAVLVPLLFYCIILSDLYFRNSDFNPLNLIIYIVIGLLATGFFIYKSLKYINLRRLMRLGYEGEIAVGQELNQMMLQGYNVFHDFIADKFNIDHIVVGPAGVFAVETKARAKPTSNNRAADARVNYNGTSIQFPDWKESKPLEQAKRQAAWLEKWLSSSTGEPVTVRPVVALPGWYVTRTAKEGIPVINPKQFSGLIKYYKERGLTAAEIKRIVHQIEKHCRNIKPKAIKAIDGTF